MIELVGVEFAYPTGGFRIRVDRLELPAGQKVALTGPSGSGKTTLVHLIAGILTPDAGRIHLAGVDIAGLPFADRQDVRAVKMGLVFQEFELLDYLTLVDNILLPYRLSPVLELTDEVRTRAVTLGESVGLGDKLDRYPTKLSQGERQRVAVCRALITRPAVLLGDEPTGNLDPANRDHVIDTMFEYSEQSGAPLVVVTHDSEIVPRFDLTVDVGGLG